MNVDHLATLPRAVQHLARVQKTQIAYVFEGRETTYGAFGTHTDRVANGLLAAGLAPGDRIAYLGKNCDHYFELLIGAAKAGVVITPISWRLAAPEVEYIAAHCDAALLFVGNESVELAQSIASQLPALRGVVAMEDAVVDWPAYQDWRDGQATTPPTHVSRPDDVVLQLYTSGTTGRPKGAMLTHRNLTVSAIIAERENIAWLRWVPDDVSLVAMPVAHIGGTGWGLRGLLAGAKGIVVRDFDPRRVLDFIANDRISKLFLVPSAIQIVLRDPRARQVNYSRLRYLIYGSAPMPADLLREGMEVFGCGFVQTYGMTETTGSVTGLMPEDHASGNTALLRAAGRALPWAEVAVVDAAGKHVPPGEVGEVIVRSLQTMAGYWKQPEETARAINADGWLRTGDAGYMDADDYLYIHDRVKDMIISGGENVYPAEVENAIYGHPHVAEVAVIGVPDARWGEAVKAIVVPRDGATPDARDILQWARERLAGFKLPKSIDFVDALPRNPSGKVLRRQLREPYWQGYTRRVN
ncbi:fatty acid--CoA ligase [Cupriavidus pinatubonensis]|uniref:fatty acid--CoA ligase n=1 Tax=Cupriavidus pinatubonensis TaxID=248026 RepID=UPI001126FF10|nr:fatty acid--CoA ligase [Cupriavidus pinatubonensis]TPQ39996.1 acyl-CoA synthetase [Cupriavidus pinatubonensis]